MRRPEYHPARKQWRCFHCDEVFRSVAAARIHFGDDRTKTCACLLSHERHLVEHIRDLEDQLEGYRSEDGMILRSLRALEASNRQALIDAEEKGYDKGVRDGVKQNGKGIT